MSRPQQVLRFAIGTEGRADALSEIWKVWIHRSDVYFTNSAYHGRSKISLHASGVCQHAYLPDFHAKYADALGSDRTNLRWKRAATPAAGPLHVASIFFAAYESWDLEEGWSVGKPTTILPPPPHGEALEIGIVYSRQDPNNHCGHLDPKKVYLARFELDNGDFVTLLPRRFPLAEDFFDFKMIPQRARVMFLDMQQVDDARGVAISQSEVTAEGVFRIWSLHNMRFRSVPETAIPELLKFSWPARLGWQTRALLGRLPIVGPHLGNRVP